MSLQHLRPGQEVTAEQWNALVDHANAAHEAVAKLVAVFMVATKAKENDLGVASVCERAQEIMDEWEQDAGDVVAGVDASPLRLVRED